MSTADAYPVETGPDEAAAARRARMAVLARADAAELKRLWDRLGLDPLCRFIRGPETGLVTVRGRIGGGGAPFNLGEATVTRATVRIEGGGIGHAVMLGHDKAKARLAAIIDALAGDAGTGPWIAAKVIAPLERAFADSDRRRREETAATRVDFFTLVRGEDT